MTLRYPSPVMESLDYDQDPFTPQISTSAPAYDHELRGLLTTWTSTTKPIYLFTSASSEVAGQRLRP